MDGMKLSRKTDYALRALFTLVDHYPGVPISIRELARRNDAPKRFLEHIMLDMKAKGWVDSIPGTRGGYLLAKPPEAISMGEVIRHFDGILAPIACVSMSHYERCSQEPVCRFRRVLLDVRNHIARVMDRSTLALVRQNRPVTDADVFDHPLVGGAGI